MGGQHPRQRKHIFLYLACWLGFLLVFTGCASLYSQQYDEEGGLFQQTTEAGRLLSEARSSFTKGDFSASFNKSREILTRFPQKYGDRALYMMGMIYADPEYIYAKHEISVYYFDRLVKEYPESAYKNQAKIWIGLLHQNINYAKLVDKNIEQINSLKSELGSQKKQIKNLLNQIKQLKEIDLGIEEKKREALPKIGQ
jgi:hypothetical protein